MTLFEIFCCRFTSRGDKWYCHWIIVCYHHISLWCYLVYKVRFLSEPRQSISGNCLTHWTRISLSTGVRDFSTSACYLSLGLSQNVNYCLIQPILFSTTPFVTSHVKFMQHMQFTASDVQEMSRRFQINCQSCKMHAQDEINIHVRTINRKVA